jgi:hypothetical protein
VQSAFAFLGIDLLQYLGAPFGVQLNRVFKRRCGML